MTRYSLRTRLVAVVVAVTLFALFAGGVSTYVALREYLYNRIDDQLHGMAGRYQEQVNPIIDSGALTGSFPSGSVPIQGGPGRAPSLALWTVLTPSSSAAISSATIGGTNGQSVLLKLSSGDAKSLSALRTSDKNVKTVTTTDGVSVRAEATALDDGYTLVIALSTREIDATLTQLLILQTAVGGAAILAAIALGTYGVRVGLQPLTRVSYTAREIAANLKSHGSGLERRVAPSDPRTEVGQLTDAVNTMLGAAQAAYAQRVENEDRMRRFLADASHELRTPLTSLRGYAELERLRAATPGAEDADATKDALRRIETEGDRMARLVDDLLLLARTDQGSSAPELGPVSVDELLNEAADRAGAAHPTRPFLVDTPNTGLQLVGDSEVMLQVLGNLLRNAAIHTPGPRPIRLGARPDGNSVLLLIADEGPGMAPEQAAHAFERFWRADSGRTRATGGSGLGLAIVHALITAQHGAVGLTSDVATGTTVLIRMPGVLDGLGRLVHLPSPEFRYSESVGSPVAQPGPQAASSPFARPAPFTSQSPFGPPSPFVSGDVLDAGSTGRHAAGDESRTGRNRHRQSTSSSRHRWSRQEAEWRSPDQSGSGGTP